MNREIDPVDEASEESSPARMLQIRQERRRLRTTVQIALLFGIGAFARPGLTLGVLVFLHGAYALADGVSAIATALVGRPGITALTRLYPIADWAVATGVSEVVAAPAPLRNRFRRTADPPRHLVRDWGQRAGPHEVGVGIT